MSCSKCNSDFQDNADLIKCTSCKKTYHVACTRVRTAAKLAALGVKKDTWQCDDCFKPGPVPSSDTNSILQAIKNLEIKVDSKLDANTKTISSLESAVNSNTTALNGLRSDLSKVQLDIGNLKAECEGLKVKNKKLNEDLWLARQEISDVQQYTRKNNIEIVGIPFTQNEDIYLIIENIAKALKLSFSRSDISIAHRIPSTKKGKIPSIIVSFISRGTQNSWMSAGKKRDQRLTTKDVSDSLPAGDVYINDHLTPKNKFLLSYGKNLVREKKINGAWFKNAKMWVKVRADDPPIRVFTPQDIDASCDNNQTNT
ncbi:uncharacterized protein LOC120351881 [Nilaparvata lugens]|uniref:uncharacterized protein LOC120351881 n=1 Tax=Nilaparvata lugens TaxID=108931 RepID=UPI00193DCEBE|nr:uncharacterized protein LOC120351881 [Nilaparvata lugens]